MPRSKTRWSPTAERKFGKLARKGLSAREIALALRADGVPGASEATVGRRLRELLGDRRSGKTVGSRPAGALAEASPLDAMPADDGELALAPVGLLKFWHEEAAKGHRMAKRVGNLASMARFADSGARCAGALLRATPPPPADPNQALDIRAAAERGKRLLFETLENIIANRSLLATP